MEALLLPNVRFWFLFPQTSLSFLYLSQAIEVLNNRKRNWQNGFVQWLRIWLVYTVPSKCWIAESEFSTIIFLRCKEVRLFKLTWYCNLVIIFFFYNCNKLLSFKSSYCFKPFFLVSYGYCFLLCPFVLLVLFHFKPFCFLLYLYNKFNFFQVMLLELICLKVLLADTSLFSN